MRLFRSTAMIGAAAFTATTAKERDCNKATTETPAEWMMFCSSEAIRTACSPRSLFVSRTIHHGCHERCRHNCFTTPLTASRTGRTKACYLYARVVMCLLLLPVHLCYVLKGTKSKHFMADFESRVLANSDDSNNFTIPGSVHKCLVRWGCEHCCSAVRNPSELTAHTLHSLVALSLFVRRLPLCTSLRFHADCRNAGWARKRMSDVKQAYQ